MGSRVIVVAAVLLLLAVAPQAHGWGGGGKGNGGGAVSGAFEAFRYSGTCEGNVCSGRFVGPGGSPTGKFVATADGVRELSEPLAGLLVGLGLLGARYLRRR